MAEQPIDSPGSVSDYVETALQSRDVLAGLGTAPRVLLATVLALFEDSTLQQHLSRRIDEVIGKYFEKSDTKKSAEDSVCSLQMRVMAWMNSSASEQELRLIVWMRLREAMGLPPSTFGALRSTRTAADDLVAAVLAFIQPDALEKAKSFVGWGEVRDVPNSLDALARQTMQELVDSLLKDNGKDDAAAREALLRGAKEQIEKLDPATQERLLRAINANELNDDAIRTLLLTGGGLTALGGAVSLAGFSAYILAAQASAFIPLVSGPALVSFVAVLSNPITIVLATFGAGWLATRNANQKIQAAIAMRVTALLALNGITAGEAGLRTLTRAFPLLTTMRQTGELPQTALQTYQADWGLIASAHQCAQSLDAELARVVDAPPPGKKLPDRWQRLLGNEAAQDVGALSMLTLGELLYLVQSLDPKVLAAADFARIADLSDPVKFAEFAHHIDRMNASSHLGAISNVKGYVAEQVVAAKLVEQGHVVEFPDTSNQAGWDLSVDGIRFQVKNAAELDLLQRHFESYEFPVLVNSEVAELLEKARMAGNAPAWADHVHFVEGYSSDTVEQMTTDALDAGDAMLHPHVPVFAVLLTAARNLERFAKGEVTGSQAVQDVMVNGSVRAGLAVAGNFAGVGIGLLVFGPAGALVLGNALPIVGYTQSSRVKKGLEKIVRGQGYSEWERQAKDSLGNLHKTLDVGVRQKITQVKGRSSEAKGSAADYLAWRRDDDCRYLRECCLRLSAIFADKSVDVEPTAERLMVWMSSCTLHPALYQKELKAWMEVWSKRPGLADGVGEVIDTGTRLLTGLGQWLAGKSKRR